MSNNKVDSVHKRLRILIEENTNENRRFKDLEEKTRLPSATWKSYWTTGSRPSSALIEAAALAWPLHAYWLVTGMDDSAFGHRAPNGTGFPTSSKEQVSSEEYFRASVTLDKKREEAAGEYLDEFRDDVSQRVIDQVKRSAHQLPGTEIDAQSDTSLTNDLGDLRWAEVLLDTFIPKFDYEQTQAVLPAITKVLNNARSKAKDSSIERAFQAVSEKLVRAEADIKRWQNWKEHH